MSKVIKNNDGVAVVEGTPAASLVKDVDKFFASKPPERMAGESISQPKRIDPRAINTRQPTPKDTEQMNDSLSRMSFENLSAEEQAKRDTARREKRMGKRRVSNKEESQLRDKAREMMSERRETIERDGRPVGENPNRNKAKEKAESRRKRFFERRRSRKEAERSQTEQEATQGKFITTLKR